MYTVEGLRNGIERCKVNIKALEGAVKDERETIKNYKIMISQIEEAAQKKAEADAHVEVVDERAH